MFISSSSSHKTALCRARNAPLKIMVSCEMAVEAQEAVKVIQRFPTSFQQLAGWASLHQPCCNVSPSEPAPGTLCLPSLWLCPVIWKQ